jgi:hypothetical protein
MNRLSIAALFILIAALPACGDNLVEFPLSSDGATADASTGADGSTSDGPADASDGDASIGNPDARTDATTDARPDASADANTAPPTVVSTDPDDDDVNVATTKRISATFSEPMNATTLNRTTFLLRQGVTAVDGDVSYANGVATFVPDMPLGLGLEYTATITTGARDPQGMALAADHVWTFTVADCNAQLPVELGRAGAFAVLAGSAVTNTGLTVVTGDLGVSPLTSVTGFNPPGVVVGMIHAGDTAAANAIFDLEIAYNNAAGRTQCPVSAIGNIGGRTLTPGLYKSTSDMSITSGDLTLDAQGDSDAVFIFQIASELRTTSDRKVILIGNARASRVFWQVGSSAALGTGTVFAGTIMADQAITMATGTVLQGRALARIALVSLDASIVTLPVP